MTRLDLDDDPICDECHIEISRCVHGCVCGVCGIAFDEDDGSCHCTKDDNDNGIYWVWIDDEQNMDTSES